MKVLVIGATGLTGAHAVRKLLARGDTVTALARDPSRITETHARLRVAQGDARDAASLDAAVAGQDAVLVAFGPRSRAKDDLAETLMRHLVAAMKAHGVARVVNLSAWGVGPVSDATVPKAFKVYRFLMLRHVWADKERGEALLVASGLDYVNVQPGRLLDAPARGGIQTSLGDGAGLRPEMTREDTADFMVAALEGDAWVRKTVVIGY